MQLAFGDAPAGRVPVLVHRRGPLVSKRASGAQAATGVGHLEEWSVDLASIDALDRLVPGVPVIVDVTAATDADPIDALVLAVVDHVGSWSASGSVAIHVGDRGLAASSWRRLVECGLRVVLAPDAWAGDRDCEVPMSQVAIDPWGAIPVLDGADASAMTALGAVAVTLFRSSDGPVAGVPTVLRTDDLVGGRRTVAVVAHLLAGRADADADAA